MKITIDKVAMGLVCIALGYLFWSMAAEQDAMLKLQAEIFQDRIDRGECKPFEQTESGHTYTFICDGVRIHRPRRLRSK